MASHVHVRFDPPDQEAIWARAAALRLIAAGDASIFAPEFERVWSEAVAGDDQAVTARRWSHLMYALALVARVATETLVLHIEVDPLDVLKVIEAEIDRRDSRGRREA